MTKPKAEDFDDQERNKDHTPVNPTHGGDRLDREAGPTKGRLHFNNGTSVSREPDDVLRAARRDSLVNRAESDRHLRGKRNRRFEREGSEAERNGNEPTTRSR